jgi:hypothetical protein
MSCPPHKEQVMTACLGYRRYENSLESTDELSLTAASNSPR